MEIKYSCQGQPLAYTRFGDPLPVDENGELRWHMVNWGTDMDPYHQIGLLSNVFQKWNRYLAAFDFVSTAKDDYKWSIMWSLDDKIHMPDGTIIDSPFSFNNNPDILAVQFPSPNLVCVINDNYDYSLDKPGPNVHNLAKVLLHEIGHGLRLGHTTVKGDIMWDRYDPDAKITEDTINGLYELHKDQMIKFLRKPNMLMIGKLYGVPEPIEKSQNKGCLGLLL